MNERVLDGGNSPPLAQHGRTGWARAHVRVGAHYPLISVRYSMRSAGASDSGLSVERPVSDATDIARYALALAEAFAADGKAPRWLEVDATAHVLHSGAAPLLVLRVAGDVPGVDQDALAATATAVLVDRKARGDLPPSAEATVQPVVLSEDGDVVRVALRRHPVWRARWGWPLGLPRPRLRPRAAFRWPRPRVVLRFHMPRVPRPRLAFRPPRLRLAWPRFSLGVPRVAMRAPRLPGRVGRGSGAAGVPRRAFRLPPWPRLAFRLPRLRLAWPRLGKRVPSGGGSAPAWRAAAAVSGQNATGFLAGDVSSAAAAPARRRPARRGLIAAGAAFVTVAVAALAISIGYGNLADWADLGLLPDWRVQPAPTLSAAPVAAEPSGAAVQGPVVEPTTAVIVEPTAAPVEPTAAVVAAPAEVAGLATTPTPATGATVAESTVVPPAVAVAPAANASSTPAAGGRVLLDVAPRPGLAGWPSDPNSTAWLAADGYHLFARQAERFAAVGLLPAGQQPRDVLVSATFHKTGGPAGGGYGIIVRDQGPPPRDGLNQGGRYYVFEVGDLGQVGIWRREGDRWAEILGWTDSAAVHPGAAENTLLVRASGEQFTLSVNGTQVATSTDPVLAQGGVGVFLGGDQNQAVLTQLKIQSND